MCNADLSFVHELDDGSDVVVRSVLQDDHLVLLVELGEYVLKVRAAGGQNDLVSSEGSTFGREEDVGQVFSVEETAENSKEVALVIVPAQRVLVAVGRVLKKVGDGNYSRQISYEVLSVTDPQFL